MHQFNFLEAHSPAISPDGNSIAFVGLIPKGWENVYVLSLENINKKLDQRSHLKQITNEAYSWKHLTWESEGIYGASNRTANEKYNIYLIDPLIDSKGAGPTIFQKAQSKADQYFPTKVGNQLFFQSWENGSSQIHKIEDQKESILTQAKIGFSNPQARQNQIYTLGLKSGRFHLYRIPDSKFLNLKITQDHAPTSRKPWTPLLTPLSNDEVKSYRPFVTSGTTRIDNLGAFFSTGSVAGISGTMSDLMRDYSLSGQFAYLGQLGLANTYLMFGSQRGRTTWNLGGYHILQPRLDNLFPSDQLIRTYVQRETGFVSSIQYPLGAFSYIDLTYRMAGVNRSSFSDPSLQTDWQSQNPGLELLMAPVIRFGYDRVLYETFAGPLEGYGFLIESETNYFPRRASLNQRARLDFSYYLQILPRTVLVLQTVAGGSWGGSFRNGFLVSSDDILRAYPPFDRHLFGNYLLATKAELRLPIGSLVRLPILWGILAYDYGSIFARKENLGRNITSSASWGINLSLPPLSITFLFAYPQRTAPDFRTNDSTFHFLTSLSLLINYFNCGSAFPTKLVQLKS